MITIGLDFGTHQTKVCIEEREGVERRYSFMKHKDADGKVKYTLPSIINIDSDGKLSYGYVTPSADGQIVRYFKQGAFRTIPTMKMSQEDALYYSCWYIASVLFDLEEKYGQSFAVQMGVPTDGGHYEAAKQVAVRILASAYKLIEDVFHNDKKAFLNTNIAALKKLTTIEKYSIELKDEYAILVFPEAYACLKPLTSKGKIPRATSLMIDIGGGTTDISFFTIVQDEKRKNKEMVPVVYDFHSIDMGLNFLTNALQKEKGNSIQSTIDSTKAKHKGIFHSFSELFAHHHDVAHQQPIDRITSNVESELEIDSQRKEQFVHEIEKYVSNLINRLRAEYKHQTSLSIKLLEDALKNRPLIYCGGGSTFRLLQKEYSCFTDKKMITYKDWDIKAVEDAKEIIDLGLVPILSTSYGLAISVEDDNITQKPFRDICEGLRKAEEERKRKNHGSHQLFSSHGKYDNYGSYDDYDTWK